MSSVRSVTVPPASAPPRVASSNVASISVGRPSRRLRVVPYERTSGRRGVSGLKPRSGRRDTPGKNAPHEPALEVVVRALDDVRDVGVERVVDPGRHSTRVHAGKTKRHAPARRRDRRVEPRVHAKFGKRKLQLEDVIDARHPRGHQHLDRDVRADIPRRANEHPRGRLRVRKVHEPGFLFEDALAVHVHRLDHRVVVRREHELAAAELLVHLELAHDVRVPRNRARGGGRQTRGAALRRRGVALVRVQLDEEVLSPLRAVPYKNSSSVS
eukprot:30856-Pelagococcus_subviridis.AAC.10